MAVVGLNGERHVYVDPRDDTTEYVSVTTVLHLAEDKPWIGPWYRKMAFLAITRDLEEFTERFRAEQEDARRWVNGEVQKMRDLAAEIGVYLHDVVEALVQDWPVPLLPEHLIGQVTRDGDEVTQEYVDSIVEGFLQFVADFGIGRSSWEASELTVCDTINGWAGTGDGILTLDQLGLVLFDLKTGRRKPATWTSQVETYRRAKEVWIEGPGGVVYIQPMPITTHAAVLHVRSPLYPDGYKRGYKFYRVPERQQQPAYELFLHLLNVWKLRDDIPDEFEGEVWYPPLPDGSQPLPMLEDVRGHGNTAQRLVRADAFREAAGLGHLNLDNLLDLAGWTRKELLALPGVGKGSIPHIEKMLAPHGLALRAAVDVMTGAA